MASWTEKKFATVLQALGWLNGVMVGSLNLHANGADVDSKTFIVYDGTADRTVTFTPPKSRNWTLDEIIAKINAVAQLAGSVSAKASLANRAGAVPDRRVQIAGTVAFTIRGNGTANAELGFVEGASPATDVVQEIIPNTEIAVFVNVTNGPGQRWVLVRYA